MGASVGTSFLVPIRDENLARLTALKESMHRQHLSERLFPADGHWPADELAKRREAWKLFNATSQTTGYRDSTIALLATVMDESIEWVAGVLVEARQSYGDGEIDLTGPADRLQLTDSLPCS
jgi:hypothetical protein